MKSSVRLGWEKSARLMKQKQSLKDQLLLNNKIT